MDPLLTTAIVLFLAVVAFIWNRLPVGVVAIAVALTLALTGVLDFSQALAGFGDPVIVFIAALFVVSEGLDSSGVTAWAGHQLVTRAGKNPRRLIALVMLLVAALTALISVNGAVAALLPMVVVLSVRLSQPPSQLLMPLAFGAHAGSLLVLTGTPVNVLVSELAVDAGLRPFGFFEFGLVGVPLLVGTMLVCVAFGARLLPRRLATSAPKDLSVHSSTLAEHYALTSNALLNRDVGVAEVIIPPRSALIGALMFPGMVTPSGELVVVAIHRAGENLGRTTLAAGDVLLLRGTWRALDVNTADPDVLVVDSPEAIRRQAAPLGTRAKWAIGILAVMIVVLATGLVPPAVAALAAASAMVVTNVVSVAAAHRSISWTTLILVGGMIPLSTAIQTSGMADLFASSLVAAVGQSSPHLLLFAVAAVTVILGQLISNMATALIVGPVAIAIASETGISALPLLMAVAVAAAASFLTPVATPANTMVMGPGDYRFGDYWKLGLPLVAVFLLVATALVPLIWPFE